jgi:hypothetical protein
MGSLSMVRLPNVQALHVCWETRRVPDIRHPATSTTTSITVHGNEKTHHPECGTLYLGEFDGWALTAGGGRVPWSLIPDNVAVGVV